MAEHPPFVNWAGNVRSQPTRRERPRSEEEVSTAVHAAARRGERIRVVGSGHSWSPIAAPDSVMMTVSELDRLIDLDDHTVTVGAGCTLGALLEVLALRGRALPIVGSVDAQTLAGLTATGTHGSSLRHGNLSSLIRRMRLIDGRGEVVELDGDDPRLAGGRVHLGALGVVTQLTLAVEPAFKLAETLAVVPGESVLADLAVIARSAEHVKVWWLPHCGEAMVYRYQRTDERGEISALAWRAQALQHDLVFPALLRLGGLVPRLIPTINRVTRQVGFRPGRRVGRSDRVLTMPMAPRHYELELAVPLERAAEAVAWIHRWIARSGAHIDFLIELRFVPADPAWLSPAHGRDTCQIGVYAAFTPDRQRYFDAVREASAEWDGRPHWGKEMSPRPGDLDRWYPQAGRFRDLVSQLDPEGRFRNPFLDAVLQRA